MALYQEAKVEASAVKEAPNFFQSVRLRVLEELGAAVGEDVADAEGVGHERRVREVEASGSVA